MKTEHICEESKTCTCYLLADEPKDDCPVHGVGEWPPRCGRCGKFVKRLEVPQEGEQQP